MRLIFKQVRERPLLIVMLTLFVDMLGYGILIPVIPQLLGNQGSQYSLLPDSYSAEQGYILLGFLVGVFPLMQFVATPILGQLSDKFGRKKILSIALLGTSVSYAAFAYAIVTRNIPLLFISRAIDGFTGGNISVAQAAIADVSTPDNRAKNFGLVGAAFGLGFIIGPYLGGTLSDQNIMPWFNAATPFWFAAGLSLINALSVIFLFPETLKHISRTVRIDWLQSIKNIVAAYGLKSLRVPFAASFLYQSGFTFFTTFFSVFLIQKFNFTQGNIGDLFAYIGLWVAFSQIFVTPRIASRYKEHQVLKASLIAVSVLIAAHFIPETTYGLLFITPLFAIFIGLTQVNLTSLISSSVGSDVQGKILGVNSSLNALAQAIPPMLSGYVAAYLTPSAPLVISAIIIALAGVLFLTLYQRPLAKQ